MAQESLMGRIPRRTCLPNISAIFSLLCTTAKFPQFAIFSPRKSNISSSTQTRTRGVTFPLLLHLFPIGNYSEKHTGGFSSVLLQNMTREPGSNNKSRTKPFIATLRTSQSPEHYSKIILRSFAPSLASSYSIDPVHF